jgi:hypothetical protein
MPTQRYVSRELSHFVGRSLLGNAEGQYQLLATILRAGELIAANRGSGWNFRTEMFSEGEERYRQAVICFCDIPEPDLGIHIKKYGPFGIAFTRPFLTQRGARPVYYVSTTTSGSGVPMPGGSVKEQFNTLVKCLARVEVAMQQQTLIDPNHPRYGDLVLTLNSLLEQECLMFIKGFDPDDDDDSEHNFYMEREWRIAHHRMPFNLDDVHRVFMPAEFAARFRSEFPAYHNQLSFVVPET